MTDTSNDRHARRLRLLQAAAALNYTSAEAVEATRRADSLTRRAEYGLIGTYHSAREAIFEAARLADASASAFTELGQALGALVATFPSAHDDGEPGYCACGRWAERCPARAAAARGLSQWQSEDGELHPVTETIAPAAVTE